ncbi:MAG: hypothetical protein HQ498_05165 [Pseudohongiella sp.]|nr:hypothetical protein [Pseudohongiella sp.]
MRTLSNLLVIFLIIVALLAVLPLVSLGFALLGGALALAFWVLPIWIIATSDKTSGFEKCAWILAMLCLSWFAWIFYFFLAPIKPRRRHRPRYDYY